jgi:hypothetical protein
MEINIPIFSTKDPKANLKERTISDKEKMIEMIFYKGISRDTSIIFILLLLQTRWVP